MSASTPRPPRSDANGQRKFSPILARTRTVHVPLEPTAYDCVKLIFVRAGSVILFSEFGMRHVNVGDVVLLAANTLCGAEPEDWVTITTLYLDRDYVIDQVFWQYARSFTDRLDVPRFLETCCVGPAQVLRIGEDRAGMLMPWLDEFVALSVDGPDPVRFYRAQSLLFAVLDVILPHLKVTGRQVTATQRATVCPTLPRHRRFLPLRPEARRTAELLREAPERRWSLGELANEVHLSSSQLGRVFVAAFGKSPIAYLTMVRAERMAHLLGTTDTPIATVAGEVGWRDPDYAARQFRRSVGVTPRQYRALSRQPPRTERPGRSPH